MLKGKIVRIRLNRYFLEQKLWIFIGKVVEFSEHWVCLDAVGVVVAKSKTEPVEIDKESRPMFIPRESIANLRVLPDDFDLKNMQITLEGIKLGITVKGAPDTWIGEIGES